MRRHVFACLLRDVQQVNPYLQHKRDRAGHPGFSPYQKVTVTLRMMAYGSPADLMDETHIYKDEYLREPNQKDPNRLLHKAKDCGFPGMIRSRKPTVMLEEVASYDIRIWHAFFRVSGSQNDITILRRSPLFNRLMEEAYQKDVERDFGILQARWKIISEPTRGWSQENLDSIMMSCIILHNMVVEDECDGYIDGESDDDQEDPNRSRRARAKIYDGPNLPFNPRTSSIFINEYMKRYRMIRSRATNKYLQQDLVPHLWAQRSMK
ncbi:hypothetical protein TB1_027609 [Malus domestica]